MPSGSPQGFMGTTQSPSSVRFSWTPPRDENQNGRIVAYTINITETGSGAIIQRTVPGAQTTITVSPLMPFTAYDVSIVASTTVGIGPFSTLITINTPEDSKGYLTMYPQSCPGLKDPSTYSPLAKGYTIVIVTFSTI